MFIKKISIIIPIYNEEKTIEKVISTVEKVELPYSKEIILIDDGSRDGTREILKKYQTSHRVIFMAKNRGKGVAIREGFKRSTGDIVIIQDADLEYDPNQYATIIQPIVDGHADVVYGSRFVTVHPRRILYFWHYVANKYLTYLSNIFTNLNLSDMETGYKVFTGRAIKEILPCLTAERFGIEPEITAQISKHKLRIYEVGIAYHGRTYGDGKKITWRDGLAAIWHIFYYNLIIRK